MPNTSNHAIFRVKKHVARNMLAPSAVAFMQHIPYARVRIHSGAFFCLIRGNSEEFPRIKQKNLSKPEPAEIIISFFVIGFIIALLLRQTHRLQGTWIRKNKELQSAQL